MLPSVALTLRVKTPMVGEGIHEISDLQKKSDKPARYALRAMRAFYYNKNFEQMAKGYKTVRATFCFSFVTFLFQKEKSNKHAFSK